MLRQIRVFSFFHRDHVIYDKEHDVYSVKSQSEPGQSYNVAIKTSYKMPHCTCFVWRKNFMPCKHIFAVLKYKDWSDLPAEFRNNVWFTLDTNCFARTEVTNDEILQINTSNTINIESANVQTVTEESNTESYNNAIYPATPVLNTNSVQLKKCTDLLKKIQTDVHIINNTEVLQKLHEKLVNCSELLQPYISREGGLKLRPQLNRRLNNRHGMKKAYSMKSFLKKPLKRSKFGKRVGKYASIMKKQYRTTVNVSEGM